MCRNTSGWPNWAIISITEDHKALLQPGWFAICRQSFHDVDPKIGCAVPHILMNEDHALKIVEFVYRVEQNIEGLFIHCKAGISRSAAIAKWTAERFEIDFNHEYESYNKHVYQQLKNADLIWRRAHGLE